MCPSARGVHLMTDPRTTFRDATFSAETQAHLRTLHASLISNPFQARIASYAEKKALADVITRWDQNDATEEEFPEGHLSDEETVDPDGTVRDQLGNAVGIDQPAAAETFHGKDAAWTAAMLARRRRAFDDHGLASNPGYKRPGSLKKPAPAGKS